MIIWRNINVYVWKLMSRTLFFGLNHVNQLQIRELHVFSSQNLISPNFLRLKLNMYNILYEAAVTAVVSHRAHSSSSHLRFFLALLLSSRFLPRCLIFLFIIVRIYFICLSVTNTRTSVSSRSKLVVSKLHRTVFFLHTRGGFFFQGNKQNKKGTAFIK